MPDYRGLFLRGGGGQSAVIGVKQTDATYVREGEATTTLFGVQEKQMTGIRSDFDGSFVDLSYFVLTTGYYDPYGNFIRYSSGSKVDLNFKISTPGVTETRPTNVAVRYLIRALP